MIKRLFAFIFFCSCSTALFAWTDNFGAGARSAALGNASVTLSDIYAAQNNQAGLAGVKSLSGGFYYENKFLTKDLSAKGALLALPTKSGVFGLTVNSFGGKNYKENKLGLAYGKSFGDVISAGIQLDYLGTSIGEGYGKSSAFTVEAGLQARLLKNLFVGAHIFNPVRAKVADYNNEKAPTILKFGLRYNFSDKLFLCSEVQKDIDLKPVIKAGIEYQIVKDFYLRAGVSTNPVQNSFGFGYKAKYFKIDVAAAYHQTLGYSPQIALSFNLGEKSPAQNSASETETEKP